MLHWYMASILILFDGSYPIRCYIHRHMDGSHLVRCFIHPSLTYNSITNNTFGVVWFTDTWNQSQIHRWFISHNDITSNVFLRWFISHRILHPPSRLISMSKWWFTLGKMLHPPLRSIQLSPKSCLLGYHFHYHHPLMIPLVQGCILYVDLSYKL
jgi:hypothetical protein